MKSIWNYYRGESKGVLSLNNQNYEIPTIEAKRAFLLPDMSYDITRYFGFGMPANDKMLSIVLLEVGVSFLQAYVFVLLISIYLSESISLST